MFEGVLMCFDVFGREIRERRERESAQKIFFFWWQNEGLGGIYSEKVTLQLSAHLEGPLTALLMSAIPTFSRFNFGRIFEGFPELRLS